MTSHDIVVLAAEPAPAPAPDSPRRARALSEAAVVARAQDGDLDAFETLVRCYEGELFRLGYRMIGDRGEAQDALQDTLVLIWRRLPGLADPQAFRAWVFQLMTRQCLSLLRRRQRRRTVSLEPQPGGPLDTGSALGVAVGAPSPEAVAETTALVDQLRELLTDLPDELRVCWVLNELHDLTYSEIAYAVGVPVSTVRGRIARARARLAKGMAGWR